jgi:hypothetical protein
MLDADLKSYHNEVSPDSPEPLTPVEEEEKVIDMGVLPTKASAIPKPPPLTFLALDDEEEADIQRSLANYGQLGGDTEKLKKAMTKQLNLMTGWSKKQQRRYRRTIIEGKIRDAKADAVLEDSDSE